MSLVDFDLWCTGGHCLAQVCVYVHGYCQGFQPCFEAGIRELPFLMPEPAEKPSLHGYCRNRLRVYAWSAVLGLEKLVAVERGTADCNWSTDTFLCIFQTTA